LRTKIRLQRSIRAISPVISVLLMIAIAVAAALVAYAWVMGYIGGTTTKAGKAILIQSQAPGTSGIDLYVQNVGQSSVTFDPSGSVYIDDELQDTGVTFDKTTLAPGETAWIQTSHPWAQSFKAKIVTTDGTFTEKTGYYENTGTSVTYSVEFILGQGGLTMAPTEGFHSYGGNIAISATPDTGYDFAQWIATGPITFANSHSASTTATINGDGSITATFSSSGASQFTVYFEQSGAGAAPTVDYQIDGGSVIQGTVPFSVSVDDGSEISYTYQATVAGGAGTQYVRTSVSPDSPQTVTGTLTITGNYATQYYLTVTSAYGSPTGQGWYDSGSTASSSVSSPASGGAGTQYVATGYTGTGSAPSGSGASVSFPITAPSSVTWNWQTQYYLTVTSAYGTAGGAGWYNSGATAYATVTPLTVAGPTDTQYVFTQWSDDASGTTSPSNGITMNAPKTATANWKTQYQVHYAASPAAGGSTTPSAATWYDAASSGNSILATENSGYTFSSWSSSTVDIVIADEGSSSTTATINGPGTITANFAAGLDHFIITGYPSSVDSGASFGGVIVTAYDASDNVITGYTGQVYFTSSDGSATLPYTASSKYTFVVGDGGSHTFGGFALSATPSQTITVTDGTVSATSNQIIVLIGASWPQYDTSITPTLTVKETSGSFTYTITRESGNGRNLGWAAIQIPAGFTGISVSSISASYGRTWDYVVSGNTIIVHAHSSGDELSSNGHHVDVVFSMTAPSSTGTYTITSTVYQNRDGSGDRGDLQGSDPTVRVVTAIQTVTIYPGSVVYNQGSEYSGAIGDMQSDDGTYYVAQSASSSGYRIEYYGVFTTTIPAGDIIQMTVTLNGHYSSTRDQTIYLRDFTHSSWDSIDTQNSIGGTDVTRTTTLTSGFSDYVNSQQIWIRIRTDSTSSAFRHYNDYFKIEIQYIIP
jgi:FlaG/FlaF family flagellin (archaellin)